MLVFKYPTIKLYKNTALLFYNYNTLEMTVITVTRAAKCKDCRYINRFKKGKQTRHRCSNSESERYSEKYGEKTIRLKDAVCDKWEL